MSRLRCHDLREAISGLLTVSMHLQDSLSRFHRQGLRNIDLRVHVARTSTRTLAFHKSQKLLNCPCTEQSSQVSSCTSCSIGLALRFLRKHHQPVPSTRTRPELRQTMFFFLEDAYTGYHVFPTEPLTQTSIPELLRRSIDVSSPISIAQHHDRTLRSARNSRNIEIATNDHVACRISNQISQQTLDVAFITIGSCADVSGQLTNSVLDVRSGRSNQSNLPSNCL